MACSFPFSICDAVLSGFMLQDLDHRKLLYFTGTYLTCSNHIDVIFDVMHVVRERVNTDCQANWEGRTDMFLTFAVYRGKLL